MNASEQFLKNFLEDIRLLRGRRQGWSYDGPEDFLLRHGQWFAPGPPDTEFLINGKPITRMVPKRCYQNAVITAYASGGRLRYVEGYAILSLPTYHAWCVDVADRIYDVTWPTVGEAYCGVPFSVERAADALWNNQDCILADRRETAIYQHPWTKENFNLTWPVVPELKEWSDDVYGT